CFILSSSTPYLYTLSLHDALPIFCREQSHRILETLFGVDALVTQISGDTTRFFPNLVFPVAAWQPSELSLEFVRGFDRGSASYRSEEHTSELQSHLNLVCRLLLEK